MPGEMRRGFTAFGGFLACGLALAACGGSGGSGTVATSPSGASKVLAQSHQAGNLKATASAPPAVANLAGATNPKASEFPPVAGRSLKQLARLIKATAQLGGGGQAFTPGVSRYAFALTDRANRFIYGPTALYITTNLDGPAQGPFLAPADSLSVPKQYRSNENDGPGGLKAIYDANIPVPRSSVYYLLSLTRVGNHLIGAAGQVAVAQKIPIPGVGQRPPAIATDTAASVHGNISLATTRKPPENMHSVSFNQVLGKRPAVLLFSTPELCTSRVCGPVTDIMVMLQHEFGNRLTFIHQEIYVNNEPNRGLRSQLKAFHLETEPWLFTVNQKGVIAARLEGVFGVDEARAAVQAALR
ncbi:MAG: hypothetical protein ACJ764_10905 [Solirubrobacteraceae bacterium]